MDDKEENTDEIVISSTIGNNIGDIWFDSTQASYVINTGISNSVLTASSQSSYTFQEPNALEIKSGKIKIGELVMEVDQFETCLRHLLEITKREKPEEFI